MAELISNDCPLCGQPLEQVPGLCGGCRMFWRSQADIDAERTTQASQDAADSSDEPVRDPDSGVGAAADDGLLPCGHPGVPGAVCEWCGDIGAVPATVCLAVAGRLVALPQGIEVILGRESPWGQVADLFAELRQAGGVIGEAASGVSRQHASVTLAEGQIRIVDLGSRNGTWIAGREIIGRSVVRAWPVSLGLGVPGMGLDVEIRPVQPGEEVCLWTGERRD